MLALLLTRAGGGIGKSSPGQWGQNSPGIASPILDGIQIGDCRGLLSPFGNPRPAKGGE